MVVQKQKSYVESVGGATAAAAPKVRRGDIRHAVVVRTAKKLQRKDGHVVRFDDNACVLINKTGEPIGTRLTSMSSSLSFLICQYHDICHAILIVLQASSDRSYGINNGQRYYHLHQCTFEHGEPGVRCNHCKKLRCTYV